jgi:signal peptidase I
VCSASGGHDMADPIAQDTRAELAEQSTRRARSRSWVWPLLALALLALLIPAFVARVYAIPSESMEPTLHGCPGCDNDRVLVDRLSYRFADPKPGDIVVFALPDSWQNSELPPPPVSQNPVAKGLQIAVSAISLSRAEEVDFVKRVVAVGGQTVSCCDPRNRVVVDGVPLDEPYIHFDLMFGPAQQTPFAPVRVPPGQIWVMGDNRNSSVDSRAAGNGPVPVANVLGEARMIVLPFARFGTIGAAHK